jgi:Holliday junction resolvase-like predicted endonuclease
LNPICNFTPAFRAALSACSIGSTSRSIGFSQKICFPRAAASWMSCAWVSLEEQIATAVEQEQSEAATQSLLAAHLMQNGWHIERTADTASREQGIDVVASKNGRILAVEVKGYPSTSYADPRRAGETKPTPPASQARQWYSHALLKAMLTRDAHPTYDIGIGLPDRRTYRLLHERTASSLRDLQIRIAFISPSGDVNWAPDPL